MSRLRHGLSPFLLSERGLRSDRAAGERIVASGRRDAASAHGTLTLQGEPRSRLQNDSVETWSRSAYVQPVNEARLATLDEGARRPTVVIAGATGFIGSALAPRLCERYRLIGLSRSAGLQLAGVETVRQVDLFSRKNTEAALKGADIAVYLVHSMMPSARLVQAHFSDLDLLCADNFARAARSQGVRHIVYVSGLIPQQAELSEHLRSRLEVEHVLAGYGVPVTTLRAGIVVGAGGSSFQILSRLVHRLPMMVCPSWTGTKTQAVHLDGLLAVLEAVIDEAAPVTHTYDVAGTRSISYQELMSTMARVLNVRRLMLPVPFVTPRLSGLWVSMTTGAPMSLVAPLVESLRHEMVAREDNAVRHPAEQTIEVDAMLQGALHQQSEAASSAPKAFRGLRKRPGPPTVVSVQRMELPPGRDSVWAADEYLSWLPRGLGWLVPIRVVSVGEQVEFRVLQRGPVLLRLERRKTDDPEKRRVFRVLGGLLARQTERGRLEFREVLDGRTLLVGLHEFCPRLPWWIYRFTQAVFHAWVMKRFAKHLRRTPGLEA